MDENNSTETKFENFDLCGLAIGNMLSKIEDEDRPCTVDEISCIAELGNAVEKTVEVILKRADNQIVQTEDQHKKRQIKDFNDALSDNKEILEWVVEVYDNKIDSEKQIDLFENLGVMVQAGKNLLAMKEKGVNANHNIETNEDSEALTM